MYKALSWQHVAHVVLLFGFAWFAGLTLYFEPNDIQDILRLVSFALSATVASLAILGGTPIWRLFWWAIPQLNRWLYPDLNGDWEGVNHSNWTTIERTIEAATSTAKSKTFDPRTNVAPEPLEVPAAVRIRASWFHISMYRKSKDGYSESDTISVEPIAAAKGHGPKLAYVYDNSSPQPKVTDSERHYGAALLSIEQDEKGRAIKTFRPLLDKPRMAQKR